jgi:AraC-like DNA-binding protein
MTNNTAKRSKLNVLAPIPGVDEGPGLIVARARECPADHVIDWHTHRRAQLLYAAEGVMRVTSTSGVWVVPPQRAVWIPPGIEHHVRAQGAPLSLRSLYIRPDALDRLPSVCCVVTVSRLLRELILEAIELPDDPPPNSAAARLVQVLLDRIEGLPIAPLHLPNPEDARLRRIADALLDDPADARTLKEWAHELAASERTLARRFQRETGMTFGHWRQQVRLLAALGRLAAGDSVTTVAMDLGYASQSAFIAMFRRALGKTPARYFTG